MGNSALVKCEIPSFVADFVSISSWVDNQRNEYYPSDSLGSYYFMTDIKFHDGTHK